MSCPLFHGELLFVAGVAGYEYRLLWTVADNLPGVLLFDSKFLSRE